MPAHAVGILLLFVVVRVGTGLTLMMNIVYGRRWGVGGNKKKFRTVGLELSLGVGSGNQT